MGRSDELVTQVAAQQIKADLRHLHALMMTSTTASTNTFTGIPVITLPSQPEPELVALPWQCPYCGNVNPSDHLKCWDGVNGCGASRPAEYSEPPRGILHLRELGSFYVVDDPSAPVDFYTDY